MKIYKKLTFLNLLVAATLLSATTLGFAESKFKIITHKKTKVEKIKKADVISYFSTTETNWPDKSEISLIIFSYDTNEAKDFTKDFMGKTTSQVKKYYLAKIFSGSLSEAPIEVEGVEEMLELIGESKGAIGYVPAETKIAGNVKVIFP